MQELRITTALMLEISDVKVAASQINTGYTGLSDENNGLNTVRLYLEQHKKIKELLDLYYDLIERDLNDMNEMVTEIIKMDDALTGSYTSFDGRPDPWGIR